MGGPRAGGRGRLPGQPHRHLHDVGAQYRADHVGRGGRRGRAEAVPVHGEDGGEYVGLDDRVAVPGARDDVRGRGGDRCEFEYAHLDATVFADERG